MIIGIGTDICDIKRIESLIERFGKRFLAKTFTEGEQAYCDAKARPAMSYAKRFAAKEAAAKALGTGFRKGVSFQDFEIQHESSGRPKLLVEGVASQIILESGVQKLHLSISDEKRYAIANVILEK